MSVPHTVWLAAVGTDLGGQLAFDPLSWAIGLGATSTTDWLIRKAFPNDLDKQLGRAVEGWAKRLPGDVAVDPRAFLSATKVGRDDADRPRLLELRRSLEHKELAKSDQWLAALLELWAERSSDPKADAGFFSNQEREEAEEHLRELAARLHAVLASDLRYVGPELVSGQAEIKKGLERVAEYPPQSPAEISHRRRLWCAWCRVTISWPALVPEYKPKMLQNDPRASQGRIDGAGLLYTRSARALLTHAT